MARGRFTRDEGRRFAGRQLPASLGGLAALLRGLGRLAGHVAELAGWVTMIMATDELDWDNFDYKPFVSDSNTELVEKLDKYMAKAFRKIQKQEAHIKRKLAKKDSVKGPLLMNTVLPIVVVKVLKLST